MFKVKIACVGKIKESFYREAVDEYYAFVNEFPESKYSKEAEDIFRKSQKELGETPVDEDEVSEE